MSIFSEFFQLLINCGIKSDKQIDFANIIFWHYNINKILKKFINQIIYINDTFIDFSIGLSCYNPSNPLSIEELIRIADENMYGEKKKRKEGK